MPSKYVNESRTFTTPWYALSANRTVTTLGVLQEEVNCDVCVVGAGMTGLSAALELANKGFSVVLLEAGDIAGSASGRNGGHLIRGLTKSPSDLIKTYGQDTARLMCDLTLQGFDLIKQRIKTLGINCDLKMGHITAALGAKQEKELEQEIEDWARVGHEDLRYLGKVETQGFIKTEEYTGGLFDPNGGHFHPLNYALGLADAFQKQGGKIYDHSRVTKLETGTRPKVHTTTGCVTCNFVIVTGHSDIPEMQPVHSRAITALAHMIATEPVSETTMPKIMTQDYAVTDASFVMNYYRFSADRRLLFGGNCNYSAIDFQNEAENLRKKVTDLFPVLSDINIDHCWSGPIDITLNRMPTIGRLNNTVYYAHGYSGHGVILGNLVGKLMAEAINGQARHFDIFANIRHTPLPGGDYLARPLFVLGMLWYRLMDKL